MYSTVMLQLLRTVDFRSKQRYVRIADFMNNQDVPCVEYVGKVLSNGAVTW